MHAISTLLKMQTIQLLAGVVKDVAERLLLARNCNVSVLRAGTVMAPYACSSADCNAVPTTARLFVLLCST